jgi:6-phosphofructokinase
MHVKNEAERAIGKGKTVFSIRISEVLPFKALELVIVAAQWVDVFTPPLKSRVEQLAAAIGELLKLRQNDGDLRRNETKIKQTKIGRIKAMVLTEEKTRTEGRLGILVGGGPAPGINGVIGAATIEAHRHGLEVVGIYDGFKWLAKGDISHIRSLNIDDVNQVRFRGGSILHTSRENPTEDEAKIRNVVKALRDLKIRYLVTIGGDDTAFSAYKTSQLAKDAIRVAHVPKTIDNDLPLPGDMPTFGFRTAKHIGGQLVSNLVEDARTTRRWYIVVTMGRSVGHLALGMGNGAGASITLIPEEFTGPDVSLNLICDIIEGTMIKAKTLDRDYGVAVIAEGIAELMINELKHYPFVSIKEDASHHLRLAEVPFALILKRKLQERAENRKEKIAFVDVTIGYELRCADPIAFDAEYVQQLGWGAVRYLLRIGEESWTQAGAMITIEAGELVPKPFSDLLNSDTGKTRIRQVNINSDQYRCARSYMIRLERNDFEKEEQLKRLSAAARLSLEEFRKKYAYLVGL